MSIWSGGLSMRICDCFETEALGALGEVYTMGSARHGEGMRRWDRARYEEGCIDTGYVGSQQNQPSPRAVVCKTKCNIAQVQQHALH